MTAHCFRELHGRVTINVGARLGSLFLFMTTHLKSASSIHYNNYNNSIIWLWSELVCNIHSCGVLPVHICWWSKYTNSEIIPNGSQDLWYAIRTYSQPWWLWWCTVNVASRVCKKRLPNNWSIFSVEARGILVHQSTDSQLLFLLTICHVCKGFKIESSNTLSLRRFYVACMVYYRLVPVLFLFVFLVMLDW